MCGLCGVAYSDSKRPVDRDMLHRMTNMLSHRGPDGEGYFLLLTASLEPTKGP
jgi:asparagine synthase (glutamine-hydrolysing)